MKWGEIGKSLNINISFCSGLFALDINLYTKTPPYRLIVLIGAGKRLHVFLKDTGLSFKRQHLSAYTSVCFGSYVLTCKPIRPYVSAYTYIAYHVSCSKIRRNLLQVLS